MNSDLIQHFVTVVPICSLTSPVHRVLSVVKPEAEGKVLVVDPDRKPIGVVAVYDLLLGLAIAQELSTPPELIYQSQLAAVCTVLPQAYPMVEADQLGTNQPRSLDGGGTEAIASQSLQDCLEALVHHGPEWSLAQSNGTLPLRSIRCIPDSYSIHDFRLNVVAELRSQMPPRAGLASPLPPDSDVEWVVVNSQGLGVGLLDQPRVWQYLALNAISETDPLPLPAPSITSRHSRSQPLQTVESQPVYPSDLWHVSVRRLEEEQAQIQQLANELSQCQVRLKEKDDLLAYISHEMKTPLTAVMGLAELLMLAPSDHQSVRHQHYAHLIYQSSRRLIKLMASSLELIHIETQQLKVMPHPVAIAPICEAAYQQAQEDYLLFTDIVQDTSDRKPASPSNPSARVGERGDSSFNRWPNLGQRYPLMVTVQPGAEQIMADERCLKLLLTHLLTTALQLIPKEDTGGNESITVRVTARHDWITIKLTYPSKDLTAEEQRRIFQQLDPLERVESSLSGQIGLRLMLALRLAEQHRGTLTFLNRPRSLDRECPQPQMEVTVLLPSGLSPTSAENAETFHSQGSTATSTANQQGSGVVLVDHDPSRIVAAVDALSAIGYWVAIARSGQEALRKIQQLHPRIILLNPAISYLPEMDLLTVLRQNSQTQLIPIIAIAPPASASQEHIKIDGYLHFPFEPTLLQRMIIALAQTTTSETISPFSPPITLLYCNPMQWGTSWTKSPDNLPLFSGPQPLSSTRYRAEGSPQDSTIPGHPSGDILDSIDLNAILHPYNCRVIEVDSIDQAELLAKIWQPNLIVCGGSPSSTDETHHQVLSHTLMAFQQCEALARLPLITLTTKATELSHQLGLRVFPCLDPLLSVPSQGGGATALALIQVIQVAIGSQSA